MIAGLAAYFFAGAVLAAIVVPIVIVWQRRRRVGQQLDDDGPKTHAGKQGTPSIGGIAFLLASPLGLIAFDRMAQRSGSVALGARVVASGCIGLIDDALILGKKRALGLRARWKFGLVALLAVAYVELLGSHGAAASQQVWFTGFVSMSPWVWYPLAALAVLGAANAVNLTDGLDGLAAGVAVPPLLVLTYLTASPIGASELGACAGFLWYNKHPARVFMGDTGSLALGALIAGLAIEHFLLLLLPWLGVVFVAETLSVMLQVVSFTTTGKRVFKMSPLHHHFELSGWPEARVTATFIATSCVASAATFFGLMIGARGGTH